MRGAEKMRGFAIYELYEGDCLEIMPTLPDKSIDMILCDLPYGTTACRWDTAIPFEPLWEQYERIIKDNGAIVLTASQPFTSRLVASNFELFKYEWVWVKTRPFGFTHAKNAPLKKHESVLVFSKGLIKHEGQEGRMNYYPQGLQPYGKIVDGRRSERIDGTGHRIARPSNKKYVREFTKYPDTVLTIPSENKTVHPTQKPVALFEYLIKTYTNEGETVLDNCMGSGTTGVACYNTNRKFIGIEKHPEYFRIAKERVEKATAQLKLVFQDNQGKDSE